MVVNKNSLPGLFLLFIWSFIAPVSQNGKPALYPQLNPHNRPPSPFKKTPSHGCSGMNQDERIVRLNPECLPVPGGETSGFRSSLQKRRTEKPAVRELRATFTAGHHLHPNQAQFCPRFISASTASIQSKNRQK